MMFLHVSTIFLNYVYHLKMNEIEVPTFIVAGHETTSTQTTWALFALAQRPDLQGRLREELRGVETDTPSADELESEYLPFLDSVVRETLRLHAAVAMTERVAVKDDVIPVSEPYIDRAGNSCREIRWVIMIMTRTKAYGWSFEE